ncbi:MAG TPA: hypothetical protein VD835_00825, partial [Pyrinomonadaceae bacterium]|nr:hypothetical protein [Pyrinomonadaceae bacterium]
MVKPPFEKISGRKLDGALRKFFIEALGYERIDNDPDEKPGDPHYWRMVMPDAKSQPFAIAYQPGLSAMERRQVSHLYINKVAPHRDGAPLVVPSLYGFTDGARYVFFSSDPARNRDCRFDLSGATWEFADIRDKAGRLSLGNLKFHERLGRKRPRVEFLFETDGLSADSRFKSYVHAMRRELLSVVVANHRLLGVVVYHLLETPEARESGKLKFVDRNQGLKIGLGDLQLETGARLCDAVVAAVDTLLLRYIVARFLEAYHPGEIGGGYEDAGVASALEEEGKRQHRFAGDSYRGGLAEAAQAVQRELLRDPGSRGSKLIQEFLGRTDDRARREFRYEDLRPKTLQDYYESSLGLAIQLTCDEESSGFKFDIGESKRRRKELGAYYTEDRLCRLMVERAVKPLFESRLDMLRQSVMDRDAGGARKAFDAIVNFSVCDPTMGGAPFLRSAFDYLSGQYPRLCRILIEAKKLIPAFYHEATNELPFLCEEKRGMDGEDVGRWEHYILRRMLYGVDIDLKAVNVACQTFTLSSLDYIEQVEGLPSFFNLNLKHGNALVSPTKPCDRAELSRKQGKEIGELIKLRREAKTLPDTSQAYEALATLFRKIDEIRSPIMGELVQERLAPVLEKYTDELRPFCWELEFPELFFKADGSVKEDGGLDAIIGNPPWESLEVQTNEFFEQFHKGYSTLKPAAKKTEVRKKLLADPGIDKAFAHRKETVASLVKLVKPEAGFFELQHTVLDGERKRSEYATYKMIVEQCLRLV